MEDEKQLDRLVELKLLDSLDKKSILKDREKFMVSLWSKEKKSRFNLKRGIEKVEIKLSFEEKKKQIESIFSFYQRSSLTLDDHLVFLNQVY